MFEDDLNSKAEAVATAEGMPEAGELSATARQLADANARADENYNKFLLATADFENYKKRTQRDLESIVTSHRRALLQRILPVLDNLERALQYDAGQSKMRGGLEQTLKGFEAVLAAEGVKPIDVAGKPFDPHVAEAIGTVEPKNGVAEDTVVEVAQKGYTIGDELLRPARVIVAKSTA
jgi:molecular chaperone GrpE